jgi:recombinational DNA repair ATPase RecF
VPEREGAHGGEQSKLIAELFEHGVGMAQRNRHSLVYASVWLDTLGAEMEALGVDLMHHRPVLVPMLVDWAKALHTEVRLGALRCLLVYVQQCWPRNRSVEAMIRNDLQEIRDAGSGDEACVALLDGIDVALRWT